MENKHTSGNWNVERVESKYFNGFRINGQPNGGTEIARIRYVEEPEESEGVLKELEANAKLIAAAPELLEALKDLLAWANIKDGSHSQHLRDKCQSVINKAS